jgi:hypothetical protein
MTKKPSNPSIPRKLAPQQAVPLLKRQLERLQNEIIKLSKNDPNVAAWERSTINLLTNAFGQPSGNQHPNTFDFEHANCGEPIQALAFDEYEDPHEEARRQQLKQQKRAALLKSYIEQLEDEVAVSPMSPHEGSRKADGQERFGGKVFIGHGHSPSWRELKDFLQERLGLKWDEFNRESAAGLSTKERLKVMLGAADFAFLVLTAEMNIPMEVFTQGKMSFMRRDSFKEN